LLRRPVSGNGEGDCQKQSGRGLMIFSP
jgi:hypothetical protein